MDKFSPMYRSVSPSPENYLSKLSVREIVYMSRQLHITPSQLFKLSEEDLESRITECLQNQNSSRAPKNRHSISTPTERTVVCGKYRWRNVNEMKHQLLAERQEKRLQGGEMPIYPGLWAILTQAAYEVEAYIKDIQSGRQVPRSACSP